MDLEIITPEAKRCFKELTDAEIVIDETSVINWFGGNLDLDYKNDTELDNAIQQFIDLVWVEQGDD